MKKVIMIVPVFFAAVFCNAQHNNDTAQQLLPITTGKTTSLIFPYEVVHADRGSADVLMEPLRSAGNVVLIKAAKKEFAETNFSVLTGDGSYYSFTVRYDAEPGQFVYRISPQGNPGIDMDAAAIINYPAFIHGKVARAGDVEAGLQGIYIRGDVLYFQVVIQNNSSVDYDIESFRFYIVSRKGKQKTIQQEFELAPLKITGNHHRVVAGQRNVMVFAFEKFTVPVDKELRMECIEKNGGRRLLLNIPQHHITSAHILASLQ